MRDNKKSSGQTRLQVGRYALGEAIAAGGMATLHLGRLVGSAGFARTVAIKRLHPHLCLDPNFVESFADEARLAARVRHPNVVPTLDVVRAENELLLVMEYIDGDALSALFKEHMAQKKPIPLPIVIAIVSEMLHGLHAAHEAKSETGQPLGIVHRDISPQNVLVGADGVARLVDFGIARATNKVGSTGEGDVKGKLAYMAPEQIRRERVTRQTDIFAAGVVLWELLTGTRLFTADHPGATVEKILVGWVAAPSTLAKDLPRALDDIALRALDSDPNNRFETAREMAVALEDALPRALGREVAAWVESHSVSALSKRRNLVANAEKFHAETTPVGGPISLVDASLPVSSVPPTTAATPAARLQKPPPPPRPSRPSQPAEVTLHTDYSLVTADLPTGTPTPITPVLLSSDQLIPEIELPMITPIMVIPPPPEPTMTVFSANHGAPTTHESDLAFDPTVHHLADSIPPQLATYRTPKSRVVDRLAILIMAVAASVTLYFGASYTRRGHASAKSPPTAETTATSLPPSAAPEPEPAPMATGTVIGATTPVPTPTLTTSPTPPPPSSPARKPTSKPIIRTNVSPAKTPCTAKIDPVSQKKVYQGDCD
jgi:eukaryotic-like serine/threonine-protein kinase